MPTSARVTDRPPGFETEVGVRERWIFWACFAALVTTAFGFMVRIQVMGEWASSFNLSQTQSGEIFGAGMWPFAISIVLFSLVVDKIGYGKAMLIAFICHVTSVIITVCAPLALAKAGASGEAIDAGRSTGYWLLYIGTLISALGNGTVEAVINPIVATMFSKEKTKWLNILHAGWPGGLVLAGILAISMGGSPWQLKVCLILIPTAVYGVMLLGQRFPIQERVKAGVPFREMLQEAGTLGALIVVALIVREIGTRFGLSGTAQLIIGGVLVLGCAAYIRSLGRPMFILLVLIMMPLATTELGTDTWITSLMTPEMTQMGLNPAWVLIYTSAIMMILRFFAGPIVHKLSPLGLLAVSSLIAALGLVTLSRSSGLMILGAATLYGFGKTFFWPTMLGVVSERFPKGGALTLNSIAGVGMLSVGVLGAQFLGFIQDTTVVGQLQQRNPAVHAKVISEKPQTSVFGKYNAIDQDKVRSLTPEESATLQGIRDSASKNALSTVAILPVVMLLSYLGLILYFRTQGGYRAEVLTGHAATDEEYTGGTVGPGEG